MLGLPACLRANAPARLLVPACSLPARAAISLRRRDVSATPHLLHPARAELTRTARAILMLQPAGAPGHSPAGEAAVATLYSTVSRPFDPPATGKIALKVVDFRGNEVIRIATLGGDQP
jgi:hypothetical protein